MTTIHYPAKPYSKLRRDQLIQLAYALEDQRDRALRKLGEHQEPTWVNVFKAARAAGIHPEAFADIEIHYGHRATNGVLDPDPGWASAWRDQGRLVVDLHGPRQRPRRTARLVDPTPAEVLAAARLVGLDGARS